MSTHLSLHADKRPVEVETETFFESQPNEFHTLKISVGEHMSDSVCLYFNNTQAFTTFLNDLRLACENKIWDLTAMPSEYEDYAREPF
jgi:hypothetical protein